mmetsp:Transcript_24619/g.57360  ORF Transcript_24619/g.57360 Transcript_24619/m.57360 type:complete len:109 (-) Transcript_24619:35-361(-)
MAEEETYPYQLYGCAEAPVAVPRSHHWHSLHHLNRDAMWSSVVGILLAVIASECRDEARLRLAAGYVRLFSIHWNMETLGIYQIHTQSDGMLVRTLCHKASGPHLYAT